MSVETYITQVIEGKKGGICLRFLLYLISLCYQVLVTLRNKLYFLGLFKKESAAVPVICIGNIVAGGTGKTPVTALFVERLYPHFQIALLSRGYKRKSKEPLVSFAANYRENLRADAIGDEPFLLAQKFPFLMGFISKDRVAAARQAVKAGATLLIMDDGMQYQKLKKDVQVVVMDGKDLWGKGYYLPRGFLRDTPSRLKEANLIVSTGISTRSQYEEALSQIKHYTQAPLVGIKYTSYLPKPYKKVAAFCGIAKPHKFFELLQELGVEVLAQKVLEDHQSISEESLRVLAEEGRNLGAEAIFCTEKDWVKIPSKTRVSLPIEVLPLELKVIFGEEHLKDLIEKIEKRV